MLSPASTAGCAALLLLAAACSPSSPKVLFTALPVVHMYAIQNQNKDPRLYNCPVYKKPRRTDLTYITVIIMRTTQNPDHWILRGVAALCDIK